MITFDVSAIEKIRDILAEENNTKTALRVFVQGGGCSGFQYGFSLDQEQNEDDFTFDEGGIRVLVDSISAQYLEGSNIRYKEELMGSQFVIDNPNAVGSCGCGSSFAV